MHPYATWHHAGNHQVQRATLDMKMMVHSVRANALKQVCLAQTSKVKITAMIHRDVNQSCARYVARIAEYAALQTLHRPCNAKRTCRRTTERVHRCNLVTRRRVSKAYTYIVSFPPPCRPRKKKFWWVDFTPWGFNEKMYSSAKSCTQALPVAANTVTNTDRWGSVCFTSLPSSSLCQILYKWID